MSIRAWLLTLSLTAGSLVGCADDASDPDDGQGHDHPAIDFTRFDQALQKAIDDHNAASPNKIAGASAAVVHEQLGVVHTQGYGEFAADRLYLIASSARSSAWVC